MENILIYLGITGCKDKETIRHGIDSVNHHSHIAKCLYQKIQTLTRAKPCTPICTKKRGNQLTL